MWRDSTLLPFREEARKVKVTIKPPRYVDRAVERRNGASPNHELNKESIFSVF